jgi:hypothetical protein
MNSEASFRTIKRKSRGLRKRSHLSRKTMAGKNLKIYRRSKKMTLRN